MKTIKTVAAVIFVIVFIFLVGTGIYVTIKENTPNVPSGYEAGK